ncbi:hypothetical protein BJ165DRAFT_1530105 [Panaeolus papilionaceus]|nr:hypothetical protein BJ165DRAFT_1530105 [Panaeolus papilionaceus]
MKYDMKASPRCGASPGASHQIAIWHYEPQVAAGAAHAVSGKVAALLIRLLSGTMSLRLQQVAALLILLLGCRASHQVVVWHYEPQVAAAAAISDDCARFDRAISVVFPIAINATSLLFFLRTRAIYDRDRLVGFFFGFLWLLVAASSVTVPLGITVANIGPTKFCAVKKFEGYVATAAIVPLVYDTLVFIAISWRLMTDFLIVEHDIKTLAGVKALVRGDFYFPAFSRSL